MLLLLYPLTKFFQTVSLPGLKRDLVLLLRLSVQLGDGISSGTEGSMESALHIFEARGIGSSLLHENGLKEAKLDLP